MKNMHFTFVRKHESPNEIHWLGEETPKSWLESRAFVALSLKKKTLYFFHEEREISDMYPDGWPEEEEWIAHVKANSKEAGFKKAIKMLSTLSYGSINIDDTDREAPLFPIGANFIEGNL